MTGPLTIGRVTEIEELTEFKKPIRACKVDVGEPEPRDIVCGATNFAVGDLVVVALARDHAARRLHHRQAQDLRPYLGRHDLLGVRTEPRHRPRRNPRAAAGDRRAGCRCRRRRRTRRRGVRPRDHPRSRILPLDPRHGPRARVRPRPRLRRPRRRHPAARRRRGVAVDGAAGHRRPALRAAPRHGHRSDRGIAVVDAAPTAAQRHTGDLARRRRHQLRDARDRPSHARPRPIADHRGVRRAVRRAGRDGRHPRRRHPQARLRRRADRRRRRHRRDRRGDGCGHDRGPRHYHRRAVGGCGLGSGCGVADSAPTAPRQRGRPALRAHRRSGHFRCCA